jgi:hypothetical protein
MLAQTRGLLNLLLLGLLAIPIYADPVTWTVIGTFDDGGTIHGSFNYDADTNTYSNVNLVTSPGTSPLGRTYNVISPSLLPDGSHVLVLTSAAANQMGNPGTALMLTPALDDFGGTVSVTGVEATCGDSACSGNTTPQRYLTSSSAGSSEILLEYSFFHD